jgi:hypothetical protein
MASVILLDKSLVEHTVDTTTEFNHRIYNLGWKPKIGTIEENYDILVAGSGPVTPVDGDFVTDDELADALEGYATLGHTHATLVSDDDLATALAAKSNTSHTHSYAATTHTHEYATTTHTHGVTDLTATGTKSSTTVLHGDNTWKVPTGSGSVSAATETVAGIVELATTSEVTTGTDTTRAVTPAGVKAVADTKAASSHTHTASQVSDSTATGRSVLTATDAVAARTAIGAGTSTLALGSTGTTAAAGNHTHTAANVGAVEAVTAGLKMREMTQSAYDALGTKDNLTLYVIRG